MAAGPLLASEPLQRYRALGTAGDPVWRAAGQLRAAIAQRLSRQHADLLAVPEVDPSGRRIDWYAPFDGEARRLADLGAAEKAELLATVQRLHADIAKLADQMEAPEKSGAERNFARLLRHALSAPGEETLHSVDGRPVMTFWGFAAEATLPGVFLAATPPAPTPATLPPRFSTTPEAVMASAPAAVMAAPGRRTSWWQWLLLAALLLLLLAFMAWLVRPYLPHIEGRLEAQARDAALGMSVLQPGELQQTRFDTLRRDNERLQLELAKLTDEMARRGGDCSAGVVGVGGVVVGQTDGKISDKPIERGAGPDINVASKPEDKPNPDTKGQDAKGPDKSENQKNGMKDGPKDGPKDAQKDGPKDMPGQKDPKDAQKDEPKPMVVPPVAKKNEDVAFMKGDWRSRTGLATATGENDIRPNYTLDDKGKGKVSFVQKNGATCEAPAEARWNAGKLVIEEKANPKCSDGKTYARNTVNCEIGPDGTAQCKGSQPGDQRSYNVQIGR